MSNYRRALLIVMLSSFLLMLVPVLPSHASEEIKFEDAALEQQLRTWLEIPTASLTAADMEMMTYLDLPAGKIKSLKGLEHAVNLESLDIAQNEIENISPISNLVQLTELNLSYNRISDITPLASLSELKQLYMHENLIRDITPLNQLTNLEKIGISYNDISDLSPLSDLASLNSVDITNNRIDPATASNKSVIAKLKKRGVNLLGISTQKEAVPEPRLTNWDKLYDEPSDDQYYTNDYAYGNGIYVSGDGSYTSKDGVKWKNNSIPDAMHVQDIIWGKGKFVAVGFDRNNSDVIPIWTSTDGINWIESARLKVSVTVPHIAFDGTRFVIAGGHNAAGYIFTSEDGLKWTERKSGMKTDLKDVAWGNGTFVALGYEGGQFIVSKDGITWKKVKLPVKPEVSMWDLEFGGGIFIARGWGDMIASKDGVKWTSLNSKGIEWHGVEWVKNRYFMTGTKKAAGKEITIYQTSKDGVKWTPIKPTGKIEEFSLIDVIYDGKQYISHTGPAVYASTDGVNWKKTKSIIRKPYNLYNSAVGDGKLVSVGGSTDYFDPDIEKANTRGFFRIDSSGKVTYSMEDGKYPLYDVIWTGTQFFAVGQQGLMMTSKDGLKWAKTTSPTQEAISRINKINGLYYITGSNGLIMSSKDLKTWKKQKTNTTADINSISWNGKKFVAVGNWGTILVSDNGATWKVSTIKNKDGVALYSFSDVAWGNGTFIISAAQRYNVDHTYTVYQSKDGVKWNKIVLKYDTADNDLFPSLFGVRYLKDTFIAVGNNGSVYTSVDGIKWAREEFPDEATLFAPQLFNNKIYIVGSVDQVYIAEFKKEQ